MESVEARPGSRPASSRSAQRSASRGDNAAADTASAKVAGAVRGWAWDFPPMSRLYAALSASPPTMAMAVVQAWCVSVSVGISAGATADRILVWKVRR